MLYLLMYLLVGVIVICGMAAVHLVRAELKGYKAIEWWNENTPLRVVYSRQNMSNIIMGVAIWPVRTIQAFDTFKKYYDLYERK